MTKVIMFGNVKGGPGKTTLTVNLATEFAARERKVLVIDADEQRHSQWFLSKRQRAMEEGVFEGNKIEVMVTGSDNAEFDKQLKEIRNSNIYDMILIDTTGKENETFKNSVALTDTVVIPFVFSGFDVKELKVTLEYVANVERRIDLILKEHGGAGFSLDCLIVPNRSEHISATVQSEIIEMLKESGVFKYASLSSTAIKKVARWGTNLLHGLSIVDAKMPARSGFQLLADELEGKRDHRISKGDFS